MLSPDRADDISLYIHFPWCVRKCPYCDFNSHETKRDIDEHRYVNALISDFDTSLDTLAGRFVKSIFLGGGTPSLFSGHSLVRLLGHVRSRNQCREDMEVTLEANPGTLEHDDFSRYLEAGINRLSLGVQSFDDACLAAIGRIHTASAALKAVENARRSGFCNINIDLMFGLPGQSVEMSMRDCEQAMACGTEHISFYQLTLEPNTRFYLHPPKLPDHDTLFDIQQRLQESLESRGFMQYEVSAYSQPGMHCRHNIHYWEFGDYLGIGAGAHSKITARNRVSRHWNEKHPERYQKKIEGGTSWRHCRPVERDTLIIECLMNALRLKNGVRLNLCEQRTGQDRGAITDRLGPLCDEGLLSIENGRIRCSARGYLFIDEIIQRLLP